MAKEHEAIARHFDEMVREHAPEAEPDRIPESDWQWHGYCGHLIVGRWCRFHLHTEIGEYVISTVGAYVHPRHGEGHEKTEADWLKENWPGEDIGYNRKFETMVFKHTGEHCINDQCDCGLPQIESYTELDFEGYMTAGAAREGHMEMCRKWAAK